MEERQPYGRSASAIFTSGLVGPPHRKKVPLSVLGHVAFELRRSRAADRCWSVSPEGRVGPSIRPTSDTGYFGSACPSAAVASARSERLQDPAAPLGPRSPSDASGGPSRRAKLPVCRVSRRHSPLQCTARDDITRSYGLWRVPGAGHRQALSLQAPSVRH